MGAFYSFGITFNTLQDADNCKLLFTNHNLQLSDSTIVSSRILIGECEYMLGDKKQFVCAIFPNGLELPNANLKFLQPKYFYEIRNSFYKFLSEIDIEFNFAFFEFEAADFIQDNNPLLEFKNYENYYAGINEYFDGLYNADDFLQKKYLGGLVIAKPLIESSSLNPDEFDYFKNGYLWIPVARSN